MTCKGIKIVTISKTVPITKSVYVTTPYVQTTTNYLALGSEKVSMLSHAYISLYKLINPGYIMKLRIVLKKFQAVNIFSSVAHWMLLGTVCETMMTRNFPTYFYKKIPHKLLSEMQYLELVTEVYEMRSLFS